MISKYLALFGERLQLQLLVTVLQKPEFQEKTKLKSLKILMIISKIPMTSLISLLFFSEGITTNDIISTNDSVISTEPIIFDDKILSKILD